MHQNNWVPFEASQGNLCPFPRGLPTHSSIYATTPLHAAVMQGRRTSVQEILAKCPEQAEEIDSSRKWTPLHLASAKGDLGIVEALSAANPHLCWAYDRYGRNPLHLAAINGKVETLKIMARVMPLAARARTKHGDTILHLCAKHNQAEALRMLEKIIDDKEFLNLKDADGFTALQLAAIAEQMEIRMMNNSRENPLEAGYMNAQTSIPLSAAADAVSTPPLSIPQESNGKEYGVALERLTNGLLILGSLVATVAFQAGVNLPGGFWQDDSSQHNAGESVLAYKSPAIYTQFLVLNTVALLSSYLLICLLLNMERTFKSRFTRKVLIMALFLTGASFLATYVVSIFSVTPNTREGRNARTVTFVVFAVASVMYLVVGFYSSLKIWVFRLICTR